MKDYRISCLAELDLAEIWHHIASDNPVAADGFIEELLEVLEKLQLEPRMGRLREELAPGLRSHPHGNYLILYEVKYDVVHVARVVHGARRLENVILPESQGPS